MSTVEPATEARFTSDHFGPIQQWEMPVRDPIAEEQKSTPRTKRDVDFLDDLDRELAAAMQRAEEPERQLPEFPITALPKPLRAWVEAQSNQSQTPIELAAMLALASTSAAIARGTWIAARPGKQQPANLYVGLLCDSADNSGEVLDAAIAPLRELEREEIVDHPIDVVVQDRLAKEALAEIAEQERWASEEDDRTEDLQVMLEARAEVEARVGPQWPRWILEEVTARNLHRELGRRNRIACFSTEGEIFRQLSGRSSTSRDRLIDTLIAGHASRDFVATMERGRLVSIEKPAITCGSIFDDSLASRIAGQRNLRERHLLAKFLFVAPKSLVGERVIASEPMSPEIAAEYREGIRQLAARGAKRLELAEGADKVLQQFEAEIESQLAGRLAPIRLWAAQLPSQVLRIAAALQAWKDVHDGTVGSRTGFDAYSCARHENGPDSPETAKEGRPTERVQIVFRDTIEAAIAIGRYLLPHAAQLLESLGAADDDCRDSERPLLRFARLALSFTARDAMQHLRRNYLSPLALVRALNALVRRGYLRVVGQGLPCRDSGADGDIVRASPDLRSGRPGSQRYELVERRFVNDATPSPPTSSAPPIDEDKATECTQNRVETPPEPPHKNRAERRREEKKRRHSQR